MISRKDLKYFASLKVKKHRQREKKFLIEGFHLVEECLGSSYSLECVLVSEGAERSRNEKVFKKLESSQIPVYLLKEAQFSRIAETRSSQGIAGVVSVKRESDLTELADFDLIIALDRINDPGNLGTIIRTAYWFGAGAVLTGKDSVDIYNPKVIRSTQGGFFYLSICENAELDIALNDLSKNGFNIYLLDAKAGNDLSRIAPGKKTVFVFGSEADGISESILRKNYSRIKIKGYSGCESLNVAVSCGIVLHHFKNARSL